ncbi:MAG: MarR family transcriptional regulator [Hyphomonadaceae bacterium]|nr:MarR family transcriptional regulator [Hyphomonadaceae bacterium]
MADGAGAKARTSPLEGSIGYLIRDTQRLIARRLQEKIERYGLGLGQWYMLRVLWVEDGLTQRELSTRIGTGEPSAVLALNGLQDMGLIRRTADPNDGRRNIIRLTPAGRRLGVKLTPIVDEMNEAICADLNAKERATLRALVLRVRTTLAR